MTRLALSTLLAVVAWLSAAGEPRTRRTAADRRSALAAASALDAAARPPAPRTTLETLTKLRGLALRGLALRGHDQQRRPWPSRARGGEGGDSPALVAARLAIGRPAGAAQTSARHLTSTHTAPALAFPYDATAPPPAGRRA